MKVEKIDIEFANSNNGVYYAGQTMEIIAHIKVNEPVETRGIKMKMKGKSRVHWSEGSGDNRRHYSAKEKYFSTEIPLTEQRGDAEFTLHPNQYRYPVNFTLPPNLPSSFEGSHGYVRYSLKVKIDRAWKFDFKMETLFTVVSILDLNHHPDCLNPGQMQASKMICCCCCATGPVSAVMRIDRCGYVPGEAIVINAEIQNNSDRNIIKSTAKLYLQTLYTAHSHHKRECRTVAKIEKPGFGPHSSDVWSGERLVVPPVPPSELPFCSIIDLQYWLQLTVDVENTPFDLDVPIPVKIGNVPLQNFQPPTQYWGGASAFGTNNFSSGFDQPITQQPTSMPSAPPPSYAESVFGGNFTKQKSEDGAQEAKFAPQYSYFNYGNPLDANRTDEKW